MTTEERVRLDWLCSHIKDEKDPDKFIVLVQELNHLLDEKESRLGAKAS